MLRRVRPSKNTFFIQLPCGYLLNGFSVLPMFFYRDPQTRLIRDAFSCYHFLLSPTMGPFVDFRKPR